jgi:hypothetical protein
MPFPLLAAVHIWVSVTSSERGVFEQSVDDGKTWSTLCRLPCEATVLGTPDARHRVVTEREDIPVVVGGEDGDHVDIVARPSSKLKTPLLITSIGLGALSVFSLGAGVSSKEYGSDGEERGKTLTSWGALVGVASIVLLIAAFKQPNANFAAWITKAPE